MNNEELKKLLEDPKRILNIARVFHQLLHTIDKMEEEQTKKQGTTKGVQNTKVSDKLDITLKDKDGKVKTEVSQ